MSRYFIVVMLRTSELASSYPDSSCLIGFILWPSVAEALPFQFSLFFDTFCRLPNGEFQSYLGTFAGENATQVPSAPRLRCQCQAAAC